MSKTLVAYYSASGVTAKVAKNLAEAVNADLKEIKPAAVYSKEDLDWTKKTSRSYVEMHDAASRPELAEKADASAYDTVYLGFPIWWGVAPHIVNSYLESGDFSGKKIIVFATSGGSGLGKSSAELQPSAKNAEFVDGAVLKAGMSVEELKKWAAAF
ncbi:MAG: flavodoxin [Schwartzia sp.]|nr:flavodoxin [Schwartzia sp. (in: firmicutes)]